MAKQTFTTGQVLTASQMTSLQQTAMGGGSATAKTVSYVLVAADAGTTVIMNAAGSTTITVNTSLFAAGDTVLIQNIGVGTCTVTAGTATVSTAGSLALTQYEAGILYFTATGTALFHDYVQAASNPLTTTGDMIYSSSGSTQARLGIGSTSQVLTVAGGIPSWATPASGGGMTLINSGGTTLTGASVTISSIPSTYVDLVIYVENYKPATNTARLTVKINGDGTANRYKAFNYNDSSGTAFSFNDSQIELTTNTNSSTAQGLTYAIFPRYANTTTFKTIQYFSIVNDPTTATNGFFVKRNDIYNQVDAITSLVFAPSTGNFTSGTVYVYGVK